MIHNYSGIMDHAIKAWKDLWDIKPIINTNAYHIEDFTWPYLNKLPDQIMAEIIDYHMDKSTLLQLATTSKRFSWLVQKRLFHSIQIFLPSVIGDGMSSSGCRYMFPRSWFMDQSMVFESVDIPSDFNDNLARAVKTHSNACLTTIQIMNIRKGIFALKGISIEKLIKIVYHYSSDVRFLIKSFSLDIINLRHPLFAKTYLYMDSYFLPVSSWRQRFVSAGNTNQKYTESYIKYTTNDVAFQRSRYISETFFLCSYDENSQNYQNGSFKYFHQQLSNCENFNVSARITNMIWLQNACKGSYSYHNDLYKYDPKSNRDSRSIFISGEYNCYHVRESESLSCLNPRCYKRLKQQSTRDRGAIYPHVDINTVNNNIGSEGSGRSLFVPFANITFNFVNIEMSISPQPKQKFKSVSNTASIFGNGYKANSHTSWDYSMDPTIYLNGVQTFEYLHVCLKIITVYRYWYEGYLRTLDVTAPPKKSTSVHLHFKDIKTDVIQKINSFQNLEDLNGSHRQLSVESDYHTG